MVRCKAKKEDEAAYEPTADAPPTRTEYEEPDRHGDQLQVDEQARLTRREGIRCIALLRAVARNYPRCAGIKALDFYVTQEIADEAKGSGADFHCKDI